MCSTSYTTLNKMAAATALHALSLPTTCSSTYWIRTSEWVYNHLAPAIRHIVNQLAKIKRWSIKILTTYNRWTYSNRRINRARTDGVNSKMTTIFRLSQTFHQRSTTSKILIIYIKTENVTISITDVRAKRPAKGRRRAVSVAGLTRRSSKMELLDWKIIAFFVIWMLACSACFRSMTWGTTF